MNDFLNYTTDYTTNNRYLRYFNNNAAKDWDYASFSQVFTVGKSRCPREVTLRSAYKYCVKTILRDKGIHAAVKEILQTKAKDSSPPKSTNVDAAAGSQVIINYGTMRSVSANQSNPRRSPVPDNEHQAKRTRLDKEMDDLFRPHGVVDEEQCAELDSQPEIVVRDIRLGHIPKESASHLAKAFYLFKKQVLTDNKGCTLYYESNLHDALSLTHILFLKPHQYSSRQKSIIGQEALNHLYNTVLDQHCSFNNTADRDLVDTLNEIKMDLKRPTFNRSKHLSSLFSILTELDQSSFKYRIIRVVVNMLEEFPSVSMATTLGEHDVIPLVLDLVLRPILSDRKTRLRWPEINAEERRCRTRRVERPDGIISDIDNLQFIRTRAFGEVKPEKVDDRSAAIDLVRLCVFGKDNIDVHKANKVLLFHAIGCKVTIYVETLYDEGLYVVAELCTVTLPSSLQEFPTLLENLDNLLDVYLTLKTVSYNLDQGEWEANRRDTLDTPSFRATMSKSRSHRTCLVHL